MEYQVKKNLRLSILFLGCITLILLGIFLARPKPQSAAKTTTPSSEIATGPETSNSSSAHEKPLPEDTEPAGGMGTPERVISYQEYDDNLEAAINKVLGELLNMQLPPSARDFGILRGQGFRMDPKEADEFQKRITVELGKNSGPRYSFDRSKWADTSGNYRSYEYDGPNPEMQLYNGEVRNLIFAPVHPDQAEMDTIPAYEFRINLDNGVTMFLLSAFD